MAYPDHGPLKNRYGAGYIQVLCSGKDAHTGWGYDITDEGQKKGIEQKQPKMPFRQTVRGCASCRKKESRFCRMRALGIFRRSLQCPRVV